ncbi:MAG: hypothetical protein AAGA31_17990, partial [Bacteroidota bacterium]
MHQNTSDQPEHLTIVPDGCAKIVIVVQDGTIVRYLMAGIWIRENDFIVPPNAINYGCRLKILAPEFLLGHEIATLLQGVQQLDTTYLGVRHFDLSSFEAVVRQWEM